MSRRTSRRFGNGPPPDAAWAWFTREMLESAAWAAMPLAARRVVERIMIEHMSHAGTQNGELVVTYDDFAKFHLSSRNATGRAIRIAIALGFIDVTLRGVRSLGGARRASQYGLTWMPRRDGTAASNRWRSIATLEEAARLVAASKRRPSVNFPARLAHKAKAA